MDIITSIAELCKERDDLEDSVNRYEDWFSELIGKTVTVARKTRNKTTFRDVDIVSFDPDGWIGQDTETGVEITITLSDIISGRVTNIRE